MTATPSLQKPSQLRAVLQLLRLPNVFTAFADVLLGFLVTHQTIDEPLVLVALLVASGSLYLAGMVLNDLFDHRIDAVERPTRPLPSGRISLGLARWLGWGLLAIGILGGGAAQLLQGGASLWPGSFVISAELAGLVVAYNAILKRTPLGPLAMGGCRTLNVLLGMSAAPLAVWQPMHLWIAGALGIYVAGLTWFARDEAILSRRTQLTMAAAVMLAAIAALSQYPRWQGALPDELMPIYANGDLLRWNALWLASGTLVGHRLLRAIAQPTPRNVQVAVKSSILSIVVLDALCALGVQGTGGAMVILALLLPAILLGRWLYST